MADEKMAMEKTRPAGGAGDSEHDFEDSSASAYIDPIKEGEMMRKFDIYAIGTLGLFYMFANLDRSNIGNAQIAGMPEDIGLIGNQFGTATTLLYATYVPLEAPIAILLKVIGPRYLMSFCAFSWAITTLCMGFIQNWQGLYTCRLLIGFFEAGLAPCFDVYIGLIYKRSERAKRSAIIFAFSCCSSAFGGVLAYGLTQIHGPNDMEGWRWLFMVEGMLSVCLVPVFYWFFPNNPKEAWFLNEEEKQMIKLRYDLDPSWGIDEDFSWSAIFSVFKDPKWYCFWIFQFSVDISLYGFTTFLPKIISGLGFSSWRANLLTVPVYAWGLIWYLFVAYMSDKTGYRSYWILGPLVCLIIGYSILIGADSLGVRFFACFVAVMGIYPTTSLSIMWLNDNVARHFKRAAMVGMTLCLANTAGVAVGQIYTTQTSPRYIKGLSVSLGMAVVAIFMVLTLMAGMTVVNKRRRACICTAEESGTPLPYIPEKGDMDVHFVYTI